MLVEITSCAGGPGAAGNAGSSGPTVTEPSTPSPTEPSTPAPTEPSTRSPTTITLPPTQSGRAPFDAAKFKESLAKLSTTEDISDVTMAPSNAPTPAPTNAGFKVVEKAIDTEAVLASLKFDMAVKEAQNAVMQYSMRDGIAGAMRMLLQHVEIVKVTKSGRRLQSGGVGADVKFQITSPDPDDVAQLEKDVRERAAEGAVVANIIKKAADNAVLTPRLKSMDIKVTVETSVVATQITVTEVVKDDNAPTKVAKATSGHLTDMGKAGVAIGALILVASIAVGAWRFSKEPTTPPEGGPVEYS